MEDSIKIFENTPDSKLGLIPLKGCEEMAKKSMLIW